MANVIRRSRFARKSRGADLSMISFNGVNQYGNVNHTLLDNLISISNSWNISFFYLHQSTPVITPIVCKILPTPNSLYVGLFLRIYLGGVDITLAQNGSFNIQAYRTEDNILNEGVLYHISVSFDPTKSGENRIEIYVNSVKKPILTRISRTPVNTISNNAPIQIARQEAVAGNAEILGVLSLSQLTFFNLILTEEEIIYEHKNAKPHPDTYGNIVARYEPGKNGHTILDKVQDYNPALTPYNASLINYTDAAVGIPDQSTNTAYKDFHNKQNIVTL